VILLSTWVFELLEMCTICLDMLLGLPPLQIAVGEKLLFSVAHRTVRRCTGQRTVACPVRLAIALSEQVTVGAIGFLKEKRLSTFFLNDFGG
jgi:hypothetical protein